MELDADEAPPPAPQAAHLAALLCEELLPRNVKGAWAKAARAVAALATELGIARDSSPLALAAAVNLLVFERHPPKEKVTDNDGSPWQHRRCGKVRNRTWRDFALVFLFVRTGKMEGSSSISGA